MQLQGGESSANCMSLELMVLCLHINYGITFLKSKPAFLRKKRVSSSSPPPQHIWFGGGGGLAFFHFGLDVLRSSTQAQKKVFKLALIIFTCCPNTVHAGTSQ